ncbi:MAG: hypothetical protein ACLRXQ_00825 [Phascolarctobacterium faecium]
MEFLREKNNGQAAKRLKHCQSFVSAASDLKGTASPTIRAAKRGRNFSDRNVQGLIKCADLERKNLQIVAHKARSKTIIFHWLGLDRLPSTF